ncbi:MAG: TIGR04219 family outer membrane beta-barrel protein [Gammaproteobacteria bacterium]|nr:MAG: TIGR04219 family outer membrane beta-barrel protein [Gammaproteobacteria bacterium]
MKSTRSIFVTSTCLWLMIGTANAEFIGLNIGAGNFAPADGSAYNGSDYESIDLVDDLDTDNPEQSSMVLILEHPIKSLPNIRYQGYDPDSSSPMTLNANIYFNGQTFTSGDEITSTYDLSQNDVVLYYQLYNKRLNLDLGVDLKSFDGEISLAGPNSTSVEVDETIPLLYLSARYALPNSGFYVGADINADVIDLGLSESSAHASTIMLGYDSGSGLGVEGGLKTFSLDLDDANNLDDELEYDGLYLNGYFNF